MHKLDIVAVRNQRTVTFYPCLDFIIDLNGLSFRLCGNKNKNTENYRIGVAQPSSSTNSEISFSFFLAGILNKRNSHPLLSE